MDKRGKICNTCKINKSFSEFQKDKSRKTGTLSRCKTCVAAVYKKRHSDPKISGNKKKKQKEYYLLSKTKITQREFRLRKVYKISSEIYDSLLLFQNECCAICGCSQLKNGRRLSIDHCHKTGIIRGLLCIKCNVGLGSLGDSTYLLKKAIKYLEPVENFNKEIKS